MANFLFWNISKNHLLDELVCLCHLKSIDFLLLAESTIPDDVLISALNQNPAPQALKYHTVPTNTRYIKAYTTYQGPIQDVQIDSANNKLIFPDRYVAFSIRFPIAGEILLFALHLPSKREEDTESQFANAIYLSDRIKELEAAQGHQKTLLIGDFNMDPFEGGMAAAHALNAIMDRKQARNKGGRTMSWSEPRGCTYFYNPMWGLMGDTSPGPTGTYFYGRGGTVHYFWHTFDQIILRPELLPYISPKEIEIVERAGPQPLLDAKGYIDKSFSDHLPITISLAL